MNWTVVLLVVLLGLVLVIAGGRSLFRRYQDWRIREHRRRVAWGEYRASRRNR